MTEDLIKDPSYKGNRSLTHKWKDIDFSDRGKELSTAINRELAIELANKSVGVHDDFELHPRLEKFFIKTRL